MLTLLQPSFRHSRSRRKGQALILAVLVMLFAVLLSSAFLVVIGNNGRQVGRETDKLEASRNADKGVAFVVARLKSLPTPDQWNASFDATLVGKPIQDPMNPANTNSDPGTSGGVPPQGHANYDLYYSQLDKALGWADQGYAKYPDPRRSRQAPQFLVFSHLLGANAQDDAEEGDKRFMLRITIIGLSSKNPEAWSRRVLYKTTNWNGGTLSYANFVTSFDPDTQQPIASALSAAIPSNPTPGLTTDISVYAAKGQGNERVNYSPRIAAAGNTLMISDGHTQPIVGIVNKATLTNSIYTITIRVLKAGTATGSFDPNSKVALVGSLFELPIQIDENGDGNGSPAAAEGVTIAQKLVGVSAATAPAAAPFGNGAQFNNGLNVPITTTFVGRPPVAPALLSPTVAGQNMLASTGPISIGDTSTPPTGTVPTLQFANSTNATQTIAVTQATPQAAPAQNQFLSVGLDKNSTPQIVTADSAVAPVVAPRFIKPAPLNMAFYRAQARGNGLYISNADDVEKFNGQPLSNGQLQRLWQRKSFVVGTGGNTSAVTTAAPVPPSTTITPVQAGTTNVRLCYGRPTSTLNPGDAYAYPMASGGLEAQGIRGWISPWEFLPRGALIILKGTTVTVFQDPISDASPNAPDLTKAFNATTRQFSLDGTPANGIICADGNVRVRGTWRGAPLSIVSGGNIYIEGSIQTPVVAPATVPSKIALLAKKNVVLNPTQFIPRPQGTVDTSVGRNAITGTYNGGTITVSDNTKFKLGDKIAVFSATAAPFDGWRTITGIAGNVLTLDQTLPYNGAVKVKLACDPPIVLIGDYSPTIPANENAVTNILGKEANTIEYDPVTTVANVGTRYVYKFAVGGDTLARNVPFTKPDGTEFGAATNIGVAFSHAAQKKILIFAYQGGSDPAAVPPINDPGRRSLKIRDTSYRLTLSPKPGPAVATPPTPDEQVFNLEQLTGSPDDGQSTLNTLRTQITNTSPNDTDTKANRWRLILPPAVAGAPAGLMDTLAARRFSKVTMNARFAGINPADDPDTAGTVRAKFRVPLTSSVLLFNSDLIRITPTTMTALNPVLTIGSIFGFQNGALPTTPAGLMEDPRFINIDATQSFYGSIPSWNIATGTTYPQVATAVTADTTAPGASDATAPKAKPIAFTRDGSGDYNDQLPAYYMSAMHFQRVDASNASVPASTNERQKTNMEITVSATIYAEGGSWFVIPVPTPTSNGLPPNDTAQQIEWRRPSYKVTVNGNITQMMTPSATVDYDDEPDPDGVVTGAMKRWTDTLSYQIFNTNDSKVYWQTINYRSAPLPAFATDAMGNVVADASGNRAAVALPVLPSTSDILYTSSN